MSADERESWAQAAALLLVPGWYFATMLAKVRETPVTEIDFRAGLLWNVGILIGVIIVAVIVSSIAAAIRLSVARAIEAERRGETAKAEVTDADMANLERRDERDRTIARFGEYVGGFVLGGAALGTLALALLEAEHFWIAHALYAGLVLSALTAEVIKIVAHRRGV